MLDECYSKPCRVSKYRKLPMYRRESLAWYDSDPGVHDPEVWHPMCSNWTRSRFEGRFRWAHTTLPYVLFSQYALPLQIDLESSLPSIFCVELINSETESFPIPHAVNLCYHPRQSKDPLSFLRSPICQPVRGHLRHTFRFSIFTMREVLGAVRIRVYWFDADLNPIDCFTLERNLIVLPTPESAQHRFE